MRVGADYGSQLVMLSPGAQLFAHHLEGDTYNFGSPLAEVIGNPLGLKNLSRGKWTSRNQNGSMTEVKVERGAVPGEPIAASISGRQRPRCVSVRDQMRHIAPQFIHKACNWG